MQARCSLRVDRPPTPAKRGAQRRRSAVDAALVCGKPGSPAARNAAERAANARRPIRAQQGSRRRDRDAPREGRAGVERPGGRRRITPGAAVRVVPGRLLLLCLLLRSSSLTVEGGRQIGAAGVLHRRGGRAAMAVSVGVAVGVPLEKPGEAQIERPVAARRRRERQRVGARRARPARARRDVRLTNGALEQNRPRQQCD